MLTSVKYGVQKVKWEEFIKLILKQKRKAVIDMKKTRMLQKCLSENKMMTCQKI